MNSSNYTKLGLVNNHTETLTLLLEPEGDVLKIPPHTAFEIHYEDTSPLSIILGKDEDNNPYLELCVSYSSEIYCEGKLIHKC